MKNVRTILIVLILSLGVPYCGANIFTDADDIKLGQQIDQEIRSKPQEYPILQGRPDVKQYVEQVGNAVLSSPEVKKRGIYAYKYEIIHDDKTINAFCTPGGYIYVYTGLLKFVDNEATLAGVLGHEIAHAERRHATKRITKAYGVQILLAVALGERPSQVAEITANLFAGLALLANSRSDETESDEYSFKYLQSTQYYPGSIKFFFEKIQREQGRRGGAFERLLSTHPLPQDRVDKVNAMLQSIGNPVADESNLFTQRYEHFRASLP
jgi:predicted Zn-dependent protease